MPGRKRHPLPASAEARGDEIPETVQQEKGAGDDAAKAVAPRSPPVTPNGEPYDGAPGQR